MSTPRATIGTFISTIRREDIDIKDINIHISDYEKEALFTPEEKKRFNDIVDGSRSYSGSIRYWCEYSDGWQEEDRSHTEYYSPLELIDYYLTKMPNDTGRTPENAHLLSYKCHGGFYFMTLLNERLPSLMERKRNELREKRYLELIKIEYQRHIHNEELKNQTQYRQDMEEKIQHIREKIQKIEEYQKSEEYRTSMSQYSDIHSYLQTHIDDLNRVIQHYRSQKESMTSRLQSEIVKIFQEYSKGRQDLQRTRICQQTNQICNEIQRNIDFLNQHLKKYMHYSTMNSLLDKHTLTSPDRLSKEKIENYHRNIYLIQDILRLPHIDHNNYIKIMDMEVPSHEIRNRIHDYRTDNIIAYIRSNPIFCNPKDYSSDLNTLIRQANMKAYRLSLKGRFNRWILRENQYTV